MSAQQIADAALTLPLAERVSLAQALWQSIESERPDADERLVIQEAVRRDVELSSGGVSGRTHEEVMQAARRALECD